MGTVQTGHTGLGWEAPQQFWSKATKRQQKAMVVDEVTRLEQEHFHIKVVSQGCQGAWTQSRLSFLIRAAYDTLP